MKSKIFFALFFIFLIGFTMAVPSIGIKVEPDKAEYVIGESITLTMSLINKGTVNMRPTFDVIFISESVPGPPIWSAPSNGPILVRFLIIPPRIVDTPFTNISTTGLEPGVYTFKGLILIPDVDGEVDTIISDNVNSASIVLVRAPPTAVPEIPVVFVVFIVLAVLFVVRKN